MADLASWSTGGFTYVSIDTTSTTGPTQLIAAAAGKVPLLHALHLVVGTTKGVQLQSNASTTVSSTAYTNLLGRRFRPKKKELVSIPFEPRERGAIRGVKSMNLMFNSTDTAQQLAGYAIVSNTPNT